VIQANTEGNIPDGVYTKLKTNENVLYYRTDGTNVGGCDVINLEFTENVTKFDLTKIRVYEINIGLTYGSNNETLDLTSLINQSKDEIQLKVAETLSDKYMTKEQVSSEIKLLKNKVETAVTDGNFGTKLTQNADSVRLAWNNISTVLKFETGGLTFYDKRGWKRARIDEGDYQFWRDGYDLGNIGTSQYLKDPKVKGITFNLDPQGGYMAWAQLEKTNDDAYTYKWVYSNKLFADFRPNTLNAGCEIDMHWNALRFVNIDLDEVSFEQGGRTDTYRLMDSTGEAYYELKFKNGILI